MLINIADSQFQTAILSLIFFVLALLSVRKFESKEFFPKEVTNEVKGLAILAIIFGHIGYFLVSDNRFLFPLSVLSGVGVNLFLLLSGFGLTLSQNKTPLSIGQFYKKRLVRLFIPLWLVLVLFYITDFLILGRSYTLLNIIESFIGYFPVADLIYSLNSPLWYFTLILFYYLLFPIFYTTKTRFLAPFIFILLGYVLLQYDLPVHQDVQNLYKLHYLAFPLGMLFALVYPKIHWQPNSYVRYIVIFMLLSIFGYTAIHSGVGAKPWIEQFISLITCISIILIFALKKFDIRLFGLFGIFSYEIYLLHWPILSRYYSLYNLFTPYFATLLYLGLFLGLSYLFQEISSRVVKLLNI